MEVGELLYYGGLAAAAASLLAGAAALAVFQMRGARLRRQLEQEYGPREKKGWTRV